MNKELEKLDRANNKKLFCSDCKVYKALEIIKKYPFIVHHILKGTTYYDLQHEMPYTELPSEEKYELLKEVLLWLQSISIIKRMVNMFMEKNPLIQ